MKTVIFFMALLLSVVTSCMTIVKWRYGITCPKEETPASLLKFLKKMNQSPENVYLFRDSSAYCQALNDKVFRKNMLGSMFFSQKGLLLDIKDTSKCQWSVTSFIRDLGMKSIFLIDTLYGFRKVASKLIPLAGNEYQDSLFKTVDYFVLITWGKFAGKLNQRLFDAATEIRENKQTGIQLIFVNIDMQKSWRLRKDQKLVIK